MDLMTALRTVAIDEAIRGAPALPQVINLGAGLDSRAWRMRELCESVVFEVDHPATQAYKRRSVGSLPPVAKEVRFVPLDFEREDLSAALARAGHHSHIPTFWIWEGVISYLRIHAVRTTLNVIAGRSARGSRLAAFYGSSSLGRRLLGVGLRFLGEPFRTHVSPEAMARDLTLRDFKVLSDSNALEWVRQWAEDPPGPVVRGFLRNQWLTIAEKNEGGFFIGGGFI